VPHHLSHAYQAFHQSPFDESAVLVADGSGEENCVSAFHFTASGFRRLFHFDVPQSLGWYYGAFTAYLGFHANRDEGKLMGLAALGEARKASNPWVDRLERILRVTHDGFHLDPTLLRFGGNENHPRFTDALRHYITSLDSRLEPVRVGEMIGINGSSRHKYLLPEYVDLAWAVQDRLETALLALARRLRRESGSERLCLSGGVAMNCKANGRVLAESGVRELFVHPASSDDGAAIGAALVVASSEGGNPRNPFRHAQLGPSYSTAEIESALQASGAAYEKPSDIAEATADLVAQGKLLGWFQGGMEMGARALGGRSIIACPGDAGAKDRVNGRVKFREQWRPYSPSLTAESRHLYLEDPIDTPFMIVSRRATQLLAANAAATVHVDGSVRPQTVSGETLPLWHHLLESVGARTGHPVLLNTSMNIRSEPIVCSPYDAIRCFWGAGLDAMAIGDFLVRKTANGGRPS
jgi:carbamoyltransferase